MMDPKSYARGRCPNCAMLIPFGRTLAGRGKGFPCKACGRELIVEKLSIVKGALLVGGALLAAKIFGVAGFLVTAAVVGLGDWKLARTRLVDPIED